ncbi:MAG: lysophospholipid acyltransferase family protein [candidate division WOR-3 bacterium]|nr:lysophospholipid acyltransferase family protein [candidate division WOR-3 bacterium]MCX7947424.1 lysophospholipid acyltransferase family protein [candidate division WOR-3 bacterium]MDW8151178.1 lysophospholipid acyltransferase family protein [candidate division WOR-3 bacterium]
MLNAIYRFLDDLKLYSLAIFIVISRFIPDSLLRLVFKLIAIFWFFIDKKRKDAIKNNLRIILNDFDNKMVFKTFENYMLNFADFIKVKYKSCSQILEKLSLENIEVFENVYKIKKKVILLSGHIGNWEYALNLISCLGYNVMVIIEMIDPRWLKLLNELRSSKGARLVLMNEIMEIIRFLNSGEGILIVTPDRLVGTSYIECSLFNHKRKIPAGIFKINEKFKIPMVFAYVIRGNGKYLGIVQDVYYEENMTFEKMLDFYLRNLERTLRKYPSHWFSFDFNWD